jgi:hypothetical protein
MYSGIRTYRFRSGARPFRPDGKVKSPEMGVRCNGGGGCASNNCGVFPAQWQIVKERSCWRLVARLSLGVFSLLSQEIVGKELFLAERMKRR